MGVFPCTRKIFPDTEPGSVTRAHLMAATNEFVSFQVALRSVDAATVSVSTNLPGATLFEALYIPTPGVAEWGYPEELTEHRRPEYPDPLVPVEVLTLEPDRTKAVWVRIRAETPAEGHVQLGDVRIPVHLEILPFEIPEMRSLATGIGLGGEGFARYYGVRRNSEPYWELYEQYDEALLDYRLTASRAPRRLDDPRTRNKLTDPRRTTFIAEYSGDRETMRRLWASLEEIGVQHKAWFYNIDEPTDIQEYEVARNQIQYLNEVCPGHRYGLPFFTGTEDKSTPFDHLTDWVNLWIIQTDYYSHGHGLGDRIRRQAHDRWRAGDEIWVYTALAPRGGWCNILLNHTALEHRLLFWQIYAEKIPTGYLFWHATYWDRTDDPWTDQATVKNLDPNLWGDGSLFYPGPDGPVGSIRLELIRSGLQDYELLKLAESRIGYEGVMQHVGRLTKDFSRYTNEIELFEQVRSALQQIAAQP